MHPFIWIFILALAALFLWRRKDKKTPPGPIGLPLIGSILSFGKFPHVTYAKWARKYGKVFQVNLAQETLLVINDLTVLKEAFQHPILSGRPQIELFRLFSDFKGVISSQGQVWEDQRRFTLRHLRDFGFGKNKMEALITNEVGTFLDWLEIGQPINLDRKFTIAVVNSLWTIVTSEKLPYDDPKLLELVQKSKIDIDGPKFAIIFFFPWVIKYLPRIVSVDSILAMFDSNRTFIEKPIREHKETFSDNSEPRDFIDSYLAHMQKVDSSSSFYGEEGEKQLNSTIMDLFMAGTMSTSNALLWTMLYLIMHLNIQHQLQQEIDHVVGLNRKPELSDRVKMPFTEAIILEVLRYSSFSPTGVFHTAMADLEFQNYLIKKGTLIMPNLHYIHHDPKLWGDPQNFRPSRFLSKDGGSILPYEAGKMVLFSTGRRVCIGEILARSTLFLFITNIFQQFNARPVPGAKLTAEPNFNLDGLEPQKFEVVLTPRH